MTLVYAASDLLGMKTLPYVHAHHQISLLITQMDKRQGRGKHLQESQLAAFAKQEGIPVYQTESLRSEARSVVGAYHPDVLVSVAFGRKFGPKFMDLFSWGGLNLHPSLLPKYRGSSPLQATILNGDDAFGVSVQEIAQEMDAGRIVAQEKHPIEVHSKLEDLICASAEIGKKLLVAALDSIIAKSYSSYVQDEQGVSYCDKIKKEDGKIDWNNSAVQIERMIRAYTPWPSCYSFVEGMRVRITQAEAYLGWQGKRSIGSMQKAGDEILVCCGDGILGIKRLQLAGKKELDAQSFLNGNPQFCSKQFELSDKAIV